MWTAAILAGGRARRLGGLDTSALPVGERSVLDRQLKMLRGLTPHILIVGHDDLRYREAGVRVVVDRIAGAGALGGLYTALVAALTQQIIVMACDMPFLTAPFLVHLAARGAGALRIVDAIAELEVRGIGPAELAPFDPDGRLLVNINTPDDYARALEAAEPPPRIV